MPSATLLEALSSWEVIVPCLALMLLLPIVFAVASKRSVPRRPTLAPRSPSRPAARRPRPTPPAAPPEDQTEEQA